jgi:hypothetical protein
MAIFVLVLNFALTVGIGIAWFPDLAFAFAIEEAPLGWQQSAVWVACASVSGTRAQKCAGREAVFWGGLALCLVYAALDEHFMFHEQLQDYLFYTVADGAPAAWPWIHGMLAGYALTGALLLLGLWKMASRVAWRWFWPAIVCGFAAIALDILHDSIAMQLYEELLETLAGTLFLCGLFREAGADNGESRGN